MLWRHVTHLTRSAIRLVQKIQILREFCKFTVEKDLNKYEKLSLPVPNLLKAWSLFAVDFSSWSSLQESLVIFFSCSELTAFTSRSVALSVKRGHKKNCANLVKMQVMNQ
jgi:myosin-crossreactive antigen